MSSGPRSMLKATVNVVASLVLPRSWACFTPRRPDLMHMQEAAGRLVDVHDAVCTDSVCLPKLNEQPMRVGVLLLRAVELFHALGGLLVAQAHVMQEPLHPAITGTDVESLCVEPAVHQARDRHRAEAQDV